MKKQRNTPLRKEIGLDQHHKGISWHLPATIKQANYKQTSADKKKRLSEQTKTKRMDKQCQGQPDSF